MSERGALRGLRVLMWVVIAIEVPVYLVWLVQVGYLTGHVCGNFNRPHSGTEVGPTGGS